MYRSGGQELSRADSCGVVKLSLRESARCRRVRPSAGPFSNLNSFSLLLCSSVLYLLIVASVILIGDWFPSVHTLKNIHTRVQPDPITKAMHHARSTLVCTHPVHAQRGRPSRLGFDFRARHVGAFCVRVRGARTRTNILYFNEECTQCIPISKRHTVKSKKL